LVCLIAGACSGGSSPGTSEVKSSRTASESTVTDVHVAGDPAAPANALCATFCERVADCWLKIANADPMLDRAQAKARCLQEQNACKKPTTDAHCCASVADCHDFAQCYAESTGRLSECSGSGRR
jgi:hypothetical protein